MSVCKGCGKEIVWAVSETGRKIPLDPRAPVYSVKGGECSLQKNGTNVMGEVISYYVSHFATCPKANDFSASKKKPRP